MITNRILRLIFNFLLVLFSSGLFFANKLLPNTLGDRVVLSINNIPYTQLQIEGILLVKEALRSDPEKSQIVDASNWDAALDAFIADMVIYQEAIKTNGYRPQTEIVNKVVDKVKSTQNQITKFKTRFLELGIDDTSLREQVMRIITIENLRKSRNGASENKKENDLWAQELTKAAIIRWFDNGKKYLKINPIVVKKK